MAQKKFQTAMRVEKIFLMADMNDLQAMSIDKFRFMAQNANPAILN